MDLTHIATITHAPLGTTGLILRKAIGLFIGDVKELSGQNVTVQEQGDRRVFVFCSVDQDVARAISSAQRAGERLHPHTISFMSR